MKTKLPLTTFVWVSGSSIISTYIIIFFIVLGCCGSSELKLRLHKETKKYVFANIHCISLLLWLLLCCSRSQLIWSKNQHFLLISESHIKSLSQLLVRQVIWLHGVIITWVLSHLLPKFSVHFNVLLLICSLTWILEKKKEKKKRDIGSLCVNSFSCLPSPEPQWSHVAFFFAISWWI